jgi:hypothetical protein
VDPHSEVPTKLEIPYVDGEKDKRTVGGGWCYCLPPLQYIHNKRVQGRNLDDIEMTGLTADPLLEFVFSLLDIEIT